MPEAELLPVSQQAEEIPCAVPAGDEEDLIDPGVYQRPDGIVDHRLVVDRQEMLVGHLGQRIHPRPQTSRQNDAFHAILLSPLRGQI